MTANDNDSCNNVRPATPDRRSLTPNRQNASSASMVKTPKMETPLWIKLRAELLMAPKKTVKMLRRHPVNPNFESGSVSADVAVNDVICRPRAHICKDLFGAKDFSHARS